MEGKHPLIRRFDHDMSKESLDQVIQRASSDARFKASLSDNFEGAVRPYDLSDDEKAKLAKGLGLSAPATSHPMPAVAASMEAATLEPAMEATTLEPAMEAATLEPAMEATTLEATMEATSIQATTLDETNL
jgi:hypothetical protein